MVEIHLYGKLRRHAPGSSPSKDSVIIVDPIEDKTIEMLLERVGIGVDEIYHIFLNSKLLATHNTMANWLGYQQVRESPFDWDLKVPVKDGDRIGLFGEDMAALVV